MSEDSVLYLANGCSTVDPRKRITSAVFAVACVEGHPHAGSETRSAASPESLNQKQKDCAHAERQARHSRLVLHALLLFKLKFFLNLKRTVLVAQYPLGVSVNGPDTPLHIMLLPNALRFSSSLNSSSRDKLPSKTPFLHSTYSQDSDLRVQV